MAEKKGLKNKKVLIIAAIVVSVIILVILGVIGYQIVNDKKQEVILNGEISNINSSNEVDMTIKTTGKYADTEKALKEYINEFLTQIKDLDEQYNNEEFSKILDASNIKSDRPEFTKSRELISGAKQKGEEVKTKLREMVTEEYIKKKAEEVNLSGKHKKIFIDTLNDKESIDQINEQVDNVNNYLSKIEEVFNFLTDNKGKWEVSGAVVRFNETSLVNQYNNLVGEVNVLGQKIVLHK